MSQPGTVWISGSLPLNLTPLHFTCTTELDTFVGKQPFSQMLPMLSPPICELVPITLLCALTVDRCKAEGGEADH